MRPRITVIGSILSILIAGLLMGGSTRKRADDIEIEIEQWAKKYVTKSHLDHIRATLRNMVSADELPRIEVIIRNNVHPGIDLQAVATLPELLEATYLIHRCIWIGASDWPRWFSEHEPKDEVSWTVQRRYAVCRVFELPGETVRIPVDDRMSYHATKRVLQAIRHRRFAFHDDGGKIPAPKLKQVCKIEKNANGNLEVLTVTSPSGLGGQVFKCVLSNGVLRIRRMLHWAS